MHKQSDVFEHISACTLKILQISGTSHRAHAKMQAFVPAKKLRSQCEYYRPYSSTREKLF